MEDYDPGKLFVFANLYLKNGFEKFITEHSKELFENNLIESPGDLLNLYMNLMIVEIVLARSETYGISVSDSIKEIYKIMKVSEKILSSSLGEELP